MKIFIITLLAFSFFTINAQNEVYIQYGLELSPNHPEPEKYDIADEIILNRESTDLNKSQDDFYRLEKVYLNGLANSIKSISKYNDLFDLFSFEEIEFKVKENILPYLKVSGDTVFNLQLGSYANWLIANQHVFVKTVETFDSEGDPIFDAITGDPVLEEVAEKFNLRDVICEIDFKESWEILKDGTFHKSLKMYSPAVPFYQDEKYLGNIELPWVINGEKKSKQLFKSVEYDVMIGARPEMEAKRELAYETLFYPNSWFFLYPESRKRILNPMINSVISGEIPIYSFSEKGLPAEINNDSIKSDLFFESEFVETIDEDGDIVYDSKTDNPLLVEVKIFYTSKDVVGFRFIEDWFLDEKSSSFVKDVRFYAPLVYERDENGNISGIKPLFWIKGSNLRSSF